MLPSEDIILLSVLGCKRSISQWGYIGRAGANFVRELKPNVSLFTEINSLEMCKTYQASYIDLK